MIDLTFSNKKNPSKGDILLSDPFESDQFFTRSVVLICDHNEEGSFGFVLNNYVSIDLSAIIPEFPIIDSKVSIGGPVDSESVFYIHSFGDEVPGSTKISPSIYFGGDFTKVIQLLQESKENTSKIRFFLGYSGWSPNQLMDEMNTHSWIVSSKKVVTELFDTKETKLWEKLMKRQGKKFEMMAKFPLDPTNN